MRVRRLFSFIGIDPGFDNDVQLRRIISDIWASFFSGRVRTGPPGRAPPDFVAGAALTKGKMR